MTSQVSSWLKIRVEIISNWTAAGPKYSFTRIFRMYPWNPKISWYPRVSQRTLHAWVPTRGRESEDRHCSCNKAHLIRLILAGGQFARAVASLYGSNFRSIPEITTECVGSSLSASTSCRGRTRWHFFPESHRTGLYRILTGKYFDHPRYGVIALPPPSISLSFSLDRHQRCSWAIRRGIRATVDHDLLIAFHGYSGNSRDTELRSRDFRMGFKVFLSIDSYIPNFGRTFNIDRVWKSYDLSGVSCVISRL